MDWPLTGRIADQPFARIYGSLAARHFTGALRVQQDARTYIVWWRNGTIVDADSSSPEDTLGRVALEAGLVDAASLSESVRRMAQNPGRRQLEIFLETGALKPDGAQRVARMALSRRALRLFALSPTAIYTLEESVHDRHEGGPVEPRWALYRGLRQFYDERRLEGELALLNGTAIKLAVDAATIQDAFGFTDEERILLAYLQKGYWDLADLVDACLTLARPVVLAIVCALASFELLDIQPANSVPRLRKRAREATQKMNKDSFGMPAVEPPLMAMPGTTRSPRETAAPAPMISTPSTRMSASLPPPVAQPRRAPSTTSPPPSVGNPPPPRGLTPSRGIAPIATPGVPHRVPTRAPASTTSPPPLKPQPNALRDQILHKLGQVEANVDHFQILEIPRDASATQVKAAYFQLAKTYHPDRLALNKMEDLRPQVEKIFAKLSDAFSGLGDDTRRKEYLSILAQGGEAAVKRRTDEEVEKATKILGAEEHFRKGEMALRRQMFQLAVDEFTEATALNPEEGEHHAMLAWSVWCNASDKEHVFAEVRKGLHKAVELNPRCVPAFFYMGQVYKGMNDMDRAYNSFQKALQEQPGHVDAEREIRLIEMRKGTSGGKKGGLFDRFKKK